MILYMDGARAVTLGVALLAVALRGTERRVVRGLESQGATAPHRAVASSNQSGGEVIPGAWHAEFRQRRRSGVHNGQLVLHTNGVALR